MSTRLIITSRTVVSPNSRIEWISARSSLIGLAVITVLALVLRCIELDSDFWIDEIRATLDAQDMARLVGLLIGQDPGDRPVPRED